MENLIDYMSKLPTSVMMDVGEDEFANAIKDHFLKCFHNSYELKKITQKLHMSKCLNITRGLSQFIYNYMLNREYLVTSKYISADYTDLLQLIFLHFEDAGYEIKIRYKSVSSSSEDVDDDDVAQVLLKRKKSNKSNKNPSFDVIEQLKAQQFQASFIY